MRLKFLLTLSCVYFLGNAAWASPTSMASINMPYGVSPISHQIYNLHMACFWVCCVIGVLTFGALFYSLLRYRKSKGAKAAHFHEHLGVEIIWTIIPTLILIALAIPATIVLKNIHNTDESALTVKIVGYQWKWKYEYLDQGISFFSNISTPQTQIENMAPKDPWFLLEVDKPLVIPVHTKVKILVTADDVIHAWWVPDLGVKQDAIPGFINENWIYSEKIGTFRGQCGELCGMNHAFMPIVVKVVSKEDFDKWTVSQQTFGAAPSATANPTVANAKAQPQVGTTTNQPDAQASSSPTKNTPPGKTLMQTELISLGRQQYETTCMVCHQVNGLGLKPTFPALKGSPKVIAPLADTMKTVTHGVPNTAMVGYGKLLDTHSLAAVITYIRSAWGNDALNEQKKHPISVQPEEVKAFLEKNSD